MIMYLESIIDYFKAYALEYSYFVSEEYYSGLFSKYFSVVGFIIGFIFVLLIFFSSSEDQSKVGFFKILSFVAVINSCMVIFVFLNSSIGNGFYQYSPGILGVTDNIVSGFLLTLVIISCYKGFSRNAFLLGVVAYAAVPMLNFESLKYFSSEALILMGIRIILAGSLCAIISYRKYFYTSWIWYFVFHIIIRTLTFFTPMVLNSINRQNLDFTGYSLSMVLGYYMSFGVDYIIFAVVLVFATIFERSVVNKK